MSQETIQYKFSDGEISDVIITETYEYCESPIPRPNTFAQSCSQCKELLYWVLKSEGAESNEVDLGSRAFTADTKPACVICMLAWAWYCTWSRAQGVPIPRGFELSIIILPRRGGLYVTIPESDDPDVGNLGEIAFFPKWERELLEYNHHKREHQYRSLTPLLDIARISSWLKIATSPDSVAFEHSGCAALFANGFCLIDCERKSLVKKFVPCQYLALSYVWGTPCSDWLTLRTSNKSLLMGSGVLDRSDIFGQRLPNIIKEAMQLTLEVGLTYLWVDALCIVQDDASDREYLIDAMDRIYKAAAATVIIPGSRGADDFIPGLLCRRNQIPQWQMTVVMDTSELCVQSVAFAPWLYMDLSPRNKRAWILQEQILSPRLLCLAENEAFFCTGEQNWREGSSVRLEYSELNNGACINMIDHIEHSAETSPLLYSQNLVKDYTRRDMADKADILRAFTGVYNALGSSSSDYIPIERTQGIIPRFLPQSLLWRSGLEGEPNIVSPLRLSTWTWAHWQRPACIDFDTPPNAITQAFQFGPCRTRPPSISPQALKILTASDSALRPVFESYQLSKNKASMTQCPSRELLSGEVSFWAPSLPWPVDLVSVPKDDYGPDLLLAGKFIGQVTFDSGVPTTPSHLVLLMYDRATGDSDYHGLAVTDVDGIKSRVG